MSAGPFTRHTAAGATGIPRITPWLLRGFLRYTSYYIRRNIHAVRISRRGMMPADDPDTPLVIYGNHASWWDPLTAFYAAAKLLPERRAYAPIDEQALRKYPVLGRLGFFGIGKDSSHGGMVFLKTARRVLATPGAMLLITPQGRFADVRERPLGLKPGLSRLAAGFGKARFIPAAVETVFWEERTPEILIRFGEPMVRHAYDPRTPAEWHASLEAHLAATMDALAGESMARDPAAFITLGTGRAGVGGLYDRMRALQSWLAGKRFQAKHGEL